ncbi:drug/metabolite transporter (DMT)-like permease [Motilibacter rhizosphaerae]|uniref:Drug/metabolite transporter (DMT)-like permease n=1 Tax=Motilibacter rhizosphaerae TaxID=598652 RepID=A0A4Q7NY66_9ACTN|nr:DMT family transporter [Motilibacter rhizosphaerae]RZS91332.1 drug/metabolite transporter (DMT)-like permease [Motilibacter rhizosphaerae]
MTTLQDPEPTVQVGPPASVLAAVAVTVCAWASAFLAIRGVRDGFAPGALALGRLLVGGLALSIAVAARRSWVRPTSREWGLLVLCGVAWFGIYNVALNAGEQRVDAGTAAMLVNVGPVLIALLAGALLGEGFPRWLLIGAGVAFSGVVVIAVATADGSGTQGWGVVLCLTAALVFAVGVMAQKPLVRRLPALQVTQMACCIGGVACLPFAGQLGSDLGAASAGQVAALVYLGLVPTAVAFGTWAYALSRMPAGRLGVTTYLVPPLTVLGAWPLLGETPPALALAGGVLAVCGVALTRRR